LVRECCRYTTLADFCFFQGGPAVKTAIELIVIESMKWMGGLMSELHDHGSADEHTEQTEMLIGRREVVGEAVMRFAKYTAPVMLAVLMSASQGKATVRCSGYCPE
jgi:hypothetical protein